MAILQNIELIRRPSRFHQLEMLDMLLIEMKSFFPAIRLKVIIPKDKDIDTRYLYYIVKCIKFKGTNSSLSSMNSNDVKKYIISFKNYQIFGFTGTPIFLDNAPAKPTATQIIEAKKKNSNAVVQIATTQEVFGTQLILII